MVSFKSDHLNFENFEIDNLKLSNFVSGQLALYSIEVFIVQE